MCICQCTVLLSDCLVLLPCSGMHLSGKIATVAYLLFKLTCEDMLIIEQFFTLLGRPKPGKFSL